MKSKYLFFSVALLCALPLRINASSAGTSIFPLLKLNLNARSAGIGGAFGTQSEHYIINNPSVLPWIREKQISAQHLIYVSNLNFSMLNYVHPMSRNTAFGTSLSVGGVGGIVRTEYDAASADGYKEVGSFDFSNMIFDCSYGHKVGYNLSYGLSLKYIQETIDSSQLSAAMGSLSGLYVSDSGLQVGVGIFNVGSKVQGYSLPSGSYISFGNYVNMDLFWVGEMVSYLDQTVEAKTGFEYNITEAVKLRVGYRYPLEDPGLGEFPNINITGGVGLSMKNMSLDYAWEPYGDLGIAHRIAISAKFGEKYYDVSFKDLDVDEKIERISTKLPKVSIAVAEFENLNTAKAESVVISDLMRDILSNDEKYIVINKQNMYAMLAEKGADAYHCSDLRCAIRLGKMLYVRRIIVGSLSKIANSYYLTLSLIDVEDGIVLESAVEDVKDRNDFYPSCQRMVKKLIK